MNESTIINGVKFSPVEGCDYSYDYIKIEYDLRKRTTSLKKKIFRKIVREDLFFIVYFLLRIPTFNVPFIVDRCREVAEGPQTKTLDVWARGHGKSSIITIGETAQYHLKYPEKCSCLFSFTTFAAQKFLDSVRQLYMVLWLQQLFPDILYRYPERQSPSWSLKHGITVKRKNTSRPQKTVQACGLETLPQGNHFDRRVYDDVETFDMVRSIDQLEKCFDNFVMSANVGTFQQDEVERVIGTYYSHLGTLVRIRDKKTLDGNSEYTTRIWPATDDGTANGKPVFLSQKALDILKMSHTFNSQQLCDPTPKTEMKLDPDLIIVTNDNKIPKNIYKFIAIDPAGGVQSRRSDKWGVIVAGVEPERDEIGASNLFILDMFIDKCDEAEIVNVLHSIYRKNGLISAVGYECINRTTPGWIIHLQNALIKTGIILSEEAKNLYMITPQGREKKDRITASLRLPLLHGKIHVSDQIPNKYFDYLKKEMINHPVGSDDGIDALSRIYDLIDKFGFRWYVKSNNFEPIRIDRRMSPTSWMAI